MVVITEARHTSPEVGEGWKGSRCNVIATTPTTLHDLLHAMGMKTDEPLGDSNFSVPVWRVRAGAVLQHEGARSEFVHVVRAGTFKCLKTSEDGYEQVLSFAAPGDVLGFEAVCRGRHVSSVVALEDSTVFMLPLRDLSRWRQLSPALDQALQYALSRQLARAGEIAEMMAAVAAEVRLARFLEWLSNSMADRGQSPWRLYLRMSRRDIASLLGVAHETVSRSFGALAEWGYLKVDNRSVEIIDAAGLHACTRSTRGMADEAPRRPAAAGRHRAAVAMAA